MKIVTLCRGGNCRSVAAKQILQRYLKHEVIAIGADNTSADTKKLVFNWADKIVVMTEPLLPYLILKVKCELEECKHDNCITTLDYTNKSILLDVGNDIWGNPFNEELQSLIASMLNKGAFTFDIHPLTKGKIINLDKVIDRIRKYKDKLQDRKNSLDNYV